MNISKLDRIDKVLIIDFIAHQLHKIKNSENKSLYCQLDELADISKMAGENIRQDRLLVLQSPSYNVNSLKSLGQIEILQKGKFLEKSKSLWKLLEKSIREGVEKLSNEEIILLREFIYAKI